MDQNKKTTSLVLCLVTENIHGNCKGEEVSKAKLFKGIYEAKLKFPEELGRVQGGSKSKKPFMEGVIGYFWNNRLQWNRKNCEHRKYFWNVTILPNYCDM